MVQPKKKIKDMSLEVTYEYELMPDGDERLSKIFEFLLSDSE